MARGRPPIDRTKAPRALRTWEGLSAAEKTFVQVYLDTANERYAYEQAFPDAGANNKSYNVQALLRDPRIENCLFREITARMFRGAILGTKVIIELIEGVNTTQSIKLAAAIQLRIPMMQQFRHKEKVSSTDLSLSEQSIDQLRDLVDRLESERGDQAKRVTSRATSQQDIDLLKELEPE